jgi:hypothetical protein
MASLGDEWSDRVDIVQRALAVLAEETRGWALPVASRRDELQTEWGDSPADGGEP